MSSLALGVTFTAHTASIPAGLELFSPPAFQTLKPTNANEKGSPTTKGALPCARTAP